MKKCFFPFLVLAMSLFSLPVFSQTKNPAAPQDTAALGLAGDNLDLYAVLDLFLKSKTIEGFEKTLNEQKTGINNLDLDLDKKVDFIKVITKKEDSNTYTFILQVALSKTDSQDVAVILVNRDKNKKVSVQIVGDEELYGKDYVIEPRTDKSAVTANPAYSGPEPAKDVPAATTTVVVQSAPIVQYVYSPAYVPYYPPYYYGYYPPYFAAFTVAAVAIYRHNNWYHHGGYYGGHYHGGNTVVINNRNQINHYNNSRNTSNRVQHNNASGNYGNGNRGGNANRPSTGGPSGSGGNRPSTGGPSASTRPSTGGPSAGGPSASTRQSGSDFSNKMGSGGDGRTRGSSNSGGYSGSSNRSSGSSYGGGGGSRGGGGFSGGGGGGGRGGGGGGRRR